MQIFSFDGRSYGLLFHLSPRYNNVPVNACIIEVQKLVVKRIFEMPALVNNVAS
jgi:hypothetical protein